MVDGLEQVQPLQDLLITSSELHFCAFYLNYRQSKLLTRVKYYKGASGKGELAPQLTIEVQRFLCT